MAVQFRPYRSIMIMHSLKKSEFFYKGSDIVANEQNLRVPTSEEAREIGRKGGIRSGEVRREKATMKKTLEMSHSL